MNRLKENKTYPFSHSVNIHSLKKLRWIENFCHFIDISKPDKFDNMVWSVLFIFRDIK